MIVSSYQIRNVLNVYSKQLSRGRSAQKPKPGNNNQPSDQINLSTEGKRKATIEKVAQDILSKISHYGTTDENKTKARELLRDEAKSRIESDNTKETAFVFNVIDDLNNKTTTALSVKDTNFLINRLGKLARDAVDKDAGI
jgi:hypothetical protein